MLGRQTSLRATAWQLCFPMISLRSGQILLFYFEKKGTKIQVNMIFGPKYFNYFSLEDGLRSGLVLLDVLVVRGEVSFPATKVYLYKHQEYFREPDVSE